MSFAGVVILLLALQGRAPPPTPTATPGMKEYFPGVRADIAAKTVEFDAQITPMLVKDDRAPLFFLEVLACSPNTREHETIVVSTAKPSHIHAAMLLIDLTPGSPGGWSVKGGDLVPIQPTGDRVSVRLLYKDKAGAEINADPLDWVVSAKDKSRFIDSERTIATRDKTTPPGWRFCGSKMVKRKLPDGTEREVYDADGSGTIIGLTTFGGELVGWSRIISPDASVEEPQWVVDFSKSAPAETQVRVRVRAAK